MAALGRSGPGVDRVTRTIRLFASIVSGMSEKAIAYCKSKENLAPLVKETINASSLSSAAKELMENGHELPEDLFNVHFKDGISITRAKGSKKK